MESMGPCPAGLMRMFEARVIPVCGDLGQPNLGLTPELWDVLASEIDTVFHNGATVNYLFNYDRMRDANVLGTNEVLRLAFEGRPKELNYVSTTFVFGWASRAYCMRPTSTRTWSFSISDTASQNGWRKRSLMTPAARDFACGFSGPLW